MFSLKGQLCPGALHQKIKFMAILISFGFKYLPNAELLAFLYSLVTKVKGNPKYPAEQDTILALETALALFQAATNAASNGGKILIKERKKQRDAVLVEATYLAKMVDLNARGNKVYILEAGFQPRKNNVTNREPFASPVIFKLNRGKLTGTVTGEVEKLPKGFTQLCILHSTDGGVTRKNGTYGDGKKFTAVNLPIKQDVIFWAYFVGTHGRKSDPSEPVSVFVL